MQEATLERQLGMLTEAVSTLKRNDDKIFDSINSLHEKMDARFEKDADVRGQMLKDIGKMSGSVSLIISVGFFVLKEGLTRITTGK